jgi:hypothetical protein
MAAEGLEMGAKACESRTVSATAIREKRQTTLPADITEAAGLKPGDQVDWRFEQGEIRGRKLVAQQPKTAMAKLVRRAGRLTFELPKGVEIDGDAIGQTVADERESR